MGLETEKNLIDLPGGGNGTCKWEQFVSSGFRRSQNGYQDEITQTGRGALLQGHGRGLPAASSSITMNNNSAYHGTVKLKEIF